ncbi:MAG: hypothetical protein IJL91_12880 [Bacteroidales bacterium]|nr:hypothetical protein [Bacteroidales bacterium]
MDKTSERERYMRAFSAIHHEGEINLEKKHSRLRPSVAAGLAVALAVGCTTAVVTNYRTIKSFFTFGNNATISLVEEEDGTRGTIVELHTEDITPPAEFKDGRLYFTAYGENLDITDKVSVDEGFIYTHEADELVSWVVVGLNEKDNPRNFGFAEFYRTPEGKVVGYSARTNLGEDNKGLPWLEKAKKKLGVAVAE